MLRICGPRTAHAGRRPAAPWSAAVAMSASPFRLPSTGGTANGGIGLPGVTPVAPLGVVDSVLMVISAMNSSATRPTNQP